MDDDNLRLIPLEHFENLPDVILLKIFSFLSIGDLCKAGRVCARWYELTKSPVFWRRVDASDMHLSSHQVQKFVPILPACVIHLRIRGDPTNMVVPFITPKVAMEIRERCPELQSLIIEDAFVAKHVSFTDITVEDLPQKLSILSLRKSFFHTDQFFCSVSHPTVPKIKVLDCSFCWCVEDDDISFFTRMTDLEEIYLEDCPVSDSGVPRLLKNVANLRVLDLEGTGISDTTMLLLAEHCKSLEKLFLARTAVNDYHLSMLTKSSLPKLQVLCLSRTVVGEVGLRSVILSLRSLRFLNAIDCNVSSNCAIELSCTIPQKQKLKIIFNAPVTHNQDKCHHFYRRTQEIY